MTMTSAIAAQPGSTAGATVLGTADPDSWGCKFSDQADRVTRELGRSTSTGKFLEWNTGLKPHKTVLAGNVHDSTWKPDLGP